MYRDVPQDAQTWRQNQHWITELETLLPSGNRNTHGKSWRESTREPEQCFLWTQVIPVFIATYTFVINTILVFSHTP